MEMQSRFGIRACPAGWRAGGKQKPGPSRGDNDNGLLAKLDPKSFAACQFRRGLTVLIPFLGLLS